MTARPCSGKCLVGFLSSLRLDCLRLNGVDDGLRLVRVRGVFHVVFMLGMMDCRPDTNDG